MKDDRGRPPAEAPTGRATLHEAAAIVGVSYATIYRAVQSGELPHTQADNGVITVPRAALRKMKRAHQPRPPREVVPIMVRPTAKQAAKWAKVAAFHNKRVSAWLVELADRAAARGSW